MWDLTCGGSALAEENSQQAIEREVFEEIGLKVNLSSERPKATINFIDEFDDVYIVTTEININDLKLDPNEVDKVKWASIDEIFLMIDNGEFIPYHRSLLQYFFDTRDRLGMVTKTLYFHSR